MIFVAESRPRRNGAHFGPLLVAILCGFLAGLAFAAPLRHGLIFLQVSRPFPATGAAVRHPSRLFGVESKAPDRSMGETLKGPSPAGGASADPPARPAVPPPSTDPVPPPPPEDKNAAAFNAWRDGVVAESQLIRWPVVGEAFRRTLLVVGIVAAATSVVTIMNFAFNEASQALFYRH